MTDGLGNIAGPFNEFKGYRDGLVFSRFRVMQMFALEGTRSNEYTSRQIRSWTRLTEVSEVKNEECSGLDGDWEGNG